jgi:hypothetical protein
MFHVLVTFPTGLNKSKKYCFKYPVSIPSDSIVVVDTVHGRIAAKVHASLTPKEYPYKPTQWVVGVVDHSLYDLAKAKEEEMKKLTVKIRGD